MQTNPQIRLNDGSGELRVVVGLRPVIDTEFHAFHGLSPQEFQSKGDGESWHLIRGKGWKALVSEEYLPLYKMKELAKLHEKLARETDLKIDKNSDPALLNELKRFVSESAGLRGDRLTRSPDFNAVISSTLTVTLELNGKSVDVAISGQSGDRQEPDRVSEVADEQADESYLPVGPDRRAKSPFEGSGYRMLPMCLSVVDITSEHRLDMIYSEIAKQVGEIREVQRVKMREAYLNFLTWANSESARLLAMMPMNGSSNGWPKELKDEMVRRVKDNYKELGFSSQQEAELWAESGPTLKKSKTRPYVRVEGQDPTSGQNWGFRTDMGQSWLTAPPGK